MAARTARARLLSLLVLGPVLFLFGVDFAISHSHALWGWVASDFPRRLDDHYRAEALLRTLPPGRDNVLLFGNSRADDAIDVGALEQRLAGRKLRFSNVTVVGSGVVDAAMRAPALARVEPGVVLLVIDAAGLRQEDVRGETFAYDAAIAARVFSWRDFAHEPEFHAAGLAGQLHVLARHRRSLQNSLLIGLGRESFIGIRADLVRRMREERQEGENQLVAWLKSREPDVWPNSNTRALEVLAERMNAAGVRLIALEAPAHPILIAPSPAARVAAFRAGVAALAEKRGFEFIPATSFPELDVQHFKDLIHVNDDGRARFTRALGDLLAERL